MGNAALIRERVATASQADVFAMLSARDRASKLVEELAARHIH